MDNFTFYSPTLFAFGDGEEKNTGSLVRRFGGTKVLMVYGGGRIKRNGEVESARRRKLHDGDVVEVEGLGAWKVVHEVHEKG